MYIEFLVRKICQSRVYGEADVWHKQIANIEKYFVKRKEREREIDK